MQYCHQLPVPSHCSNLRSNTCWRCTSSMTRAPCVWAMTQRRPSIWCTAWDISTPLCSQWNDTLPFLKVEDIHGLSEVLMGVSEGRWCPSWIWMMNTGVRDDADMTGHKGMYPVILQAIPFARTEHIVWQPSGLNGVAVVHVQCGVQRKWGSRASSREDALGYLSGTEINGVSACSMLIKLTPLLTHQHFCCFMGKQLHLRRVRGCMHYIRLLFTSACSIVLCNSASAI